MSIFEGRTFTSARAVHSISTTLFCFLLPWPGFFYVLYIDQLQHKWIEIPLKLGHLVAIPMHINAILLVVNIFTGMIFTIDASNIYHRGDSLFLLAALSGIYLVGGQIYAFLLFLKSRKRDLLFIIIFPSLIGAASLLQLYAEQAKVTLITMTLTLLMLFLRMQNTQANRDFLTSLYNRSIGMEYLKYQMSNKNKKKLIGGILMDIDGFKQVNDTYGHDYGDVCLRYFSQLLTDSFSRAWLICRYGGDEFLLVRILNEKHDMDENILHFIKNLEYFNIQEELPFSLGVSMGKGIADELDEADADAFLKLLDSRMYQNKADHHALGQGALESQTKR